MRPLLAFLLLLASPAFAVHFSLSLAKTAFSAGERVALKVKVLNDNGTVASNYSGWIKLRSTDPTLRIGGDADLTGNGNILISLGTNGGLFVHSFNPGDVTLSAEEYMRNSPSPVGPGSLSFAITPVKNDVVITEIMFKTVSTNYHYIELFNASDSTIDLNGLSIYKYKSSSATNKLLLAQVTAPTPLDPKCFFVVAKNRSRLLELFSVPTNAVRNFYSIKPDTYSHQLVVALNGTNRDGFEYSSSDTVDNVSLERQSSAPDAAWTPSLSRSQVLSSFFGTPGRENSTAAPAAPSGAAVTFSTDRMLLAAGETGLFSFASDIPGRAVVSLLDASGHRIKDLFAESDIGRGIDYPVQLDATDGDGRPLAVGPYVASLRFVNDALGLTARKNILVIVGWPK
jgi:hypothetical protein